MTRPLPLPPVDHRAAQERLNAHRAALRTRLIAQDMGTGLHEVDVFSAKPKARR